MARALVKTIDKADIFAASASYTITDSDGYDAIHMTTGVSNFTVTLPSAANNPGRSITLRKMDSGSGTLIIAGTIGGSSSNNTIKFQYGWGKVISDGTSWLWMSDITDRGTFTPTYDTTGTGLATVTYTNQIGFFVRSGREVTAQFFVQWTNTGASPTGNMVINGLPFAHPSTTRWFTGTCWADKIVLTASYTMLTVRSSPSTSYFEILQTGSNQTAANVLCTDNKGAQGRYIGGSVTYQID